MADSATQSPDPPRPNPAATNTRSDAPDTRSNAPDTSKSATTMGDDTPATRNHAPVDPRDATAAHNNDASAAHKTAPATQSDAPAGRDEALAAKNDVPAGCDDASAAQNDTPAGRDDAPATQNDAPAGRNDAPAAQEDAPTGPDDADTPGSWAEHAAAHASDDEDEDDDDDDENVDMASLIHEHRKSKTKAEREAARGGKVGGRDRFKDEQAAFLNQFRAAYDTVPRGKKGKNKKLAEFWHLVRAAFWAKFTWKDARSQMSPAVQSKPRTWVVTKTNDVSVHPCSARTITHHLLVHKNLFPLSLQQCRRRHKQRLGASAESIGEASRRGSKDSALLADAPHHGPGQDHT